MTIQEKLLPTAMKGVMKAKELRNKYEKVLVSDFRQLIGRQLGLYDLSGTGTSVGTRLRFIFCRVDAFLFGKRE